MSEAKMLLTSRRACEFLRDHPGATRRELATGIGRAYESTKRLILRLERMGYVARDGRYDARFRLTDKPFPESSNYAVGHRYMAARTRAAAKCFRRTELDVAVYQMVRSGRAV